MNKLLMPTNKWWTATITGVGAVVTAIVTSGWHEATKVALIGLLIQRVVAYMTPDSPTDATATALDPSAAPLDLPTPSQRDTPPPLNATPIPPEVVE